MTGLLRLIFASKHAEAMVSDMRLFTIQHIASAVQAYHAPRQNSVAKEKPPHVKGKLLELPQLLNDVIF